MPGLLRGVVRTAAVVGTASAVSGRVQHRQQGRWAAQEQPEQQPYPQQQAYAPPPAASPPPQASGMDDKLAQLRQLGELQSQGVLTSAEFEAQKSRILNS